MNKDPKRPPMPPPGENSGEIRDEELKQLDMQRKQGAPRPGGRPGGGPHGAPMFKEKPKDTKKTVKRLIKYIGASKYVLIFLIVIMVCSTLLNLAGPTLQGEAINAMQYQDEQGNFHIGVDMQRLTNVLTVMAIVYALNSVLTYFQGILSAKLSQKTVKMLRSDLFSHMVKLPVKFTDTHSHGDIVSRMTNDAENVSNTISQSIGSLISSVLTLVGSLVLMLCISPILTLAAMITIPLTVFVSAKLSKFMRKYFVLQQRLVGKINGNVEENVTSFKTVLAYGLQDGAEEQFRADAAELKKTGIKAQIFGGVMGPLMNIINNLGYLILVVCGALLVMKGSFSIGFITFAPLLVGDIQSFTQYSKHFTRPINEIANQYASILTAIAGAERIFEIIDAEPEIDEGTLEFDLEKFKGDISFRHVNFAYKDGEPVLKDFCLDVKAGQKIALVGATGSGKTTVVNLLLRFYDAQSGEILIDGVDIRKYKKSSLRTAAAIVLQDTVLFSASIEENIRFGKLDANAEQIKAAAKCANADDFIEQLSDGYQTLLSESGGNLSAGQRQLLSISRAVLADPKILVLDEATSSVDTRTEMNIQKAMIELMKGRTSLIIAHRLSTIRDSDVIIVLDGGRICEMGSHTELLCKGGKYSELYQTQFSGIKT